MDNLKTDLPYEIRSPTTLALLHHKVLCLVNGDHKRAMEQVLRHSWCSSPTNIQKLLVTAGACAAFLKHQNPSVHVSSVTLLTMTSNQPTNQSILLQLSQVLTFGMGTFDQIGYGKVQRISTKALRSTKPSTKLLSFNFCGSSLSGFSNFGLLHSMRKTEDA